MSRLRTRLDKLTNKSDKVPGAKVIIYQIGEDLKPRLEQCSVVVIFLPDNHRGDQL